MNPSSSRPFGRKETNERQPTEAERSLLYADLIGLALRGKLMQSGAATIPGTTHELYDL